MVFFEIRFNDRILPLLINRITKGDSDDGIKETIEQFIGKVNATSSFSVSLDDSRNPAVQVL